MFDRATRKKLRFNTNMGVLSVEDLWDLTMEQLNALYISLSKEKKDTGESLLADDTVENADLKLKMDIITFVFDYKQQVAEANEKRAATKRRNKRILEIIEQKQDDDLASKSVDELKGLLAASEAE